MVYTSCVFESPGSFPKSFQTGSYHYTLFSLNVFSEKMAVFLQLLFLVLLLNGEGLCQCYNGLSCSGAVVPADDQRNCCVLKSGLSFSNTGTCRPCIGEFFQNVSIKK